MKYISSRRTGKMLIAVEAAKFAQMRGKKVLWMTLDQTQTASMLSRHGALSEVVGEHYLAPRFRIKSKGGDLP